MIAGIVTAPHADLEIEELVLSVTGVAPDDAPGLADDIMRLVCERLAYVGSGEIELARVIVRPPPGASRDALIESIADAIVEALR